MIKQIKTLLQVAAKSLLGLVSLMGLSSCIFQRPVSESEVIGTYQAVPMEIFNVSATGLPDGGVEILELKRDGTCEQDITLKDGRKFSAKGTWKYHPSPNPYIIMKGTYVVVESEKIAANIEKTINIVQDLPPRRNLDGRIILGSTEGTHYQKK